MRNDAKILVELQKDARMIAGEPVRERELSIEESLVSLGIEGQPGWRYVLLRMIDEEEEGT